MPTDAAPHSELVEVFQNQRRFPVVGWSETALLPTDRFMWSSEDGVHERRRDDAAILPPGMEFRDGFDWRVEKPTGECDADGWSYALDFPRTFHRKEGFNSWVRRRKWVRAAFPAEHGSNERREHAAAPGAEHAAHHTAAPAHPKGKAPSHGDAPKPATEPAKPAVVAPTKLPPTAEELQIAKWDKVRGSRCGSVVLRVSNPRVYKETGITIRVRCGATEFSSHEFTDKAASHPKAFLEVCFLVADDTEPIHVAVLAAGLRGHALGEAVFSLRAGPIITKRRDGSPQEFEKVIMNGVYAEMGGATLPLFPVPESATSEERLHGQLGFVDAHWTFSLREPTKFDICQHCGRVPVMCSCEKDENALDLMVASMSRLHRGVHSPLATKQEGPAAPSFTQNEGEVAVQAPSEAQARKRGRLIVRVNEGENLSTLGTARPSPYVKFTYLDEDSGEERSVKTASKTGTEPNWSETIVMDVGDFSRGVRVQLFDHHTFGTDKLVAEGDTLDATLVERVSSGSGIATLGLRQIGTDVPTPAGIIVAVLTWIPFTL